MSCDTLSTGSLGLTVTMASLPEGFCPASMQELADAIAARLIVSPNQAFSSFAIGSVEPTSNVGPWLKNCLEWFVYDDATARYVPIQTGFDTLRYFDTAGDGSFVVPSNVYKVKIHAWGGGGGGSASDGGGATGSGGGGGAYGLSIVDVNPGDTVAFTIGGGGAANSNGGDTVILGRTAGGGKGAPSSFVAGVGGTATGFDVNLRGQCGEANSGNSSQEGCSAGGDAGGWGGKGGTATQNLPPAVDKKGTSPGGGGSGGSNSANNAGGEGAAGAILFDF